MNRSKQTQKLSTEIENFLKRNPPIEEALRLFEISYEQYQKALGGSYYFYTDTSTVPKDWVDVKQKTK